MHIPFLHNKWSPWYRSGINPGKDYRYCLNCDYTTQYRKHRADTL
jgi:hypothetical protein